MANSKSRSSTSISRVILIVASIFALLLSISLPIHAQSRDNVELRTRPQRIPATGTFQLQVNYVATGNRALVADIQLKANAASKFGRGSVNVNAGTGTQTITVTIANNPAPSDTNYVINLWAVDTNTFNNGNNPNAFNANTINTQYAVALGNPTTAPPATPAPPATTTTKPPTGTTAPTATVPPAPTDEPTLLPPDLDLPTLDPATDPSNPGTDPAATDPTPDPSAVDPNRVCSVKNSDVMQCSGCGYTICRNFVALYQTCAVGSCNALTQQCDATLPTCTEGPPSSRKNDAPAPHHMISWVMLMVLGVVGTWIL